MTDTMKNKLAAQIIKAEMMNDTEALKRLRAQYESLSSGSSTSYQAEKSGLLDKERNLKSSYKSRQYQQDNHLASSAQKRFSDNRVKNFIKSTSSLSQMFVQEKSLGASDEAKMFAKTAAKFSRDDMETKYFSEEIDDSQLILNKSKRHKPVQASASSSSAAIQEQMTKLQSESCDGCLKSQAKHLIIDESENVFMTLVNAKPFLSSMSNVIIRNNDHCCDSFISSSEDHQTDTYKMIEFLREAWEPQGYRCIIMETYFRNRHFSKREFVSCGKHFQIHCLPIKEKHFERARMCFKQAIQSSGGEWSMNRKLILSEGKKIHKRLPKSLSYFWVCFDHLDNGFGHVIESEQEFSRFFGLEVLSSLLDKDFNPMKLNQSENFKEQFERSRDFKLLYSKYRKQKES